MNRIRAFYRDLSLRNKLRFSYTLLILIPVTLLCIAYYWAASRSSWKRSKRELSS